MSDDIKQLKLGSKIRQLREKMGRSLESFAPNVGLSPSLLTQVEKGDITPPIATLINIAHHAGLELDYFFETKEQDKPYVVVKKGKAKNVKRELPKGKNPLSYSYKNLASGKTYKRMEPFLVEFTPMKEKVPMVEHDGEEFMHVLSGSIEFNYRKQKIILKAGDSLYFESRYAHAFKVRGKKKARAVVVLSPY